MESEDFLTRIVLVDDDPLVRASMTAVLESQRCTVRSFEDGFAALRALRQTLPDIVISDLRMPNMSGFELLAIVRRRFPHIPVIVISGEFIAGGGQPPPLLADRFFQKGSYTPQQLLSCISDLMKESPIRPHLGNYGKVPLWIPRRDADYIVITCTECLRSFAVEDQLHGDQLRTAECPSCSAAIDYLLDEAVLKILEQKRLGLLNRSVEVPDRPME